MRNDVAIIRDRFISRSELDNYALVDDYDVTVIGSSGHRFSGELSYETCLSPSSAPEIVRHPVQALTGLAFGSTTYMLGLVEALKGYDIVHTVETFHGFSEQAIKAKRKHNCKVVCTVWENIPYFCESPHYSRTWRERVKHPNATRIKETVRSETDLFLPVTRQAAEALRIEGVEEDRIKIVPIGVDPERFYPGRFEESNQTPRDLGLGGEGTINVVFVGRYTYSKGLYDLLSAWKRVTRLTDQSVQLTLIGGGDERRRVERYAAHADVPDVSVRGPVPYEDVPLVFDAADVAVLPSLPVRHWQEQYGRVILEAQATGTPVVASETGGIPDALGDVGELFQPGEPLDMSESMLTLIEDTELRREVGLQGRKRIECSRSFAHTAHKVQEAYGSVVNSSF